MGDVDPTDEAMVAGVRVGFGLEGELRAVGDSCGGSINSIVFSIGSIILAGGYERKYI
jgi:hypothetical protein